MRPLPHPQPGDPAKGRARPNQSQQRAPAHPTAAARCGRRLLPRTKWAGEPGSADALASIRRLPGARAPGLADRLGALPPLPPGRPPAGAHARGLSYPDAPRHLGCPRSGCAGGPRPRASPGRGLLPRRGSALGRLPGPARAESSRSGSAPSCLPSVGAPCCASTRTSAPHKSPRPPPGARGERRCCFRKCADAREGEAPAKSLRVCCL